MAESTSTLETPPELQRVPLVTNERKFNWITDKVSTIVEAQTPLWWWIAFLPCAFIALIGLLCIGYQISNGVGVWGEDWALTSPLTKEVSAHISLPARSDMQVVPVAPV